MNKPTVFTALTPEQEHIAKVQLARLEAAEALAHRKRTLTWGDYMSTMQKEATRSKGR